MKPVGVVSSKHSNCFFYFYILRTESYAPSFSKTVFQQKLYNNNRDPNFVCHYLATQTTKNSYIKTISKLCAVMMKCSEHLFESPQF